MVKLNRKKNETLNISENIALTLCACGCYSHSLPKEMREVNSACGTTSAGCSRLPLGGRSKKPTKVQHNHVLHGLWHNRFTLLAGVLAAARHGNLTSRKTKDEPESRDGPTCTTHDTSPSTSLHQPNLSVRILSAEAKNICSLTDITLTTSQVSLLVPVSGEVTNSSAIPIFHIQNRLPFSLVSWIINPDSFSLSVSRVTFSSPHLILVSSSLLPLIHHQSSPEDGVLLCVSPTPFVTGTKQSMATQCRPHCSPISSPVQWHPYHSLLIL